MAQDGSASAGKNGRDPMSLLIESGPPHCIYAAVDPVQSSPLQAVLDGLGAQAELEQLRPRDHSMLFCGERPGRVGQLLID